MKEFDFKEIRNCLYRRFDDEDVFEMRLMGAVIGGDRKKRNYSGYFKITDFDEMQKLLTEIDSYEALWSSANPLLDHVKDRSSVNFTSEIGSGSKNVDVKRIKNMFIDFDVIKAEEHKKNCSSEKEKKSAWPSVRECVQLLKGHGFPDPMEITDSGNGYHVLYRCDLPPTYSGLIAQFLKILKYLMANDYVKIDESVHNSGRMIRSPGSMNQKGLNLEDRPWRMAETIEENNRDVVSAETIQKFVDSHSWIEKAANSQVSNKSDMTIQELADTASLDIRNINNPVKRGSTFIYRAKCVMCNSSGYDAYVIKYKDGFSYSCFHDTCEARQSGTAKFAKKYGIHINQVKSEDGEVVLVSDVFMNTKFDGPTSLKMPKNYKYEDGFIKSMDGRGGKDITSQAIYISATLEDISTEEEYVQLCWLRNNKWRYKIVPKRSVVDRQKIIELSSIGLSVGSDNATALIGYLRSFHIENEGAMKLARSSSRMGWQDDLDGEVGFLWGEKYIGKNSVVSNDIMSNKSARHWPDNSIFFQAASGGETQLVKTLTSSGSLEKWQETMSWCCDHPNLLTMILGSFCSPLLEILKQDNFVMDYCNRTSSGKTTGLTFAASVWGNPDKSKGGSLVRSWDITPTSAERVAHARNHMPLLMDDTKASRDLSIVVNIIYKLANSQNRGRGNISGTEMDKNFRNVIISTGEESISDFSRDGGSVARILQVSGPMFTKAGKGFSIEMQEKVGDVYENYGMAGPMFVKYLIDNRNRWGDWRNLHREKLLKVNTRNENILNRLAKCMATIMVCADILRESGILNLDENKVQQSLDLIWEKCRENTDNSDREVSALMCLEDELIEKRDCVIVVRPEEIGENYKETLQGTRGISGFNLPIAKCYLKKDGSIKELIVHVKTVKDVLKRNGYHYQPMITQWSGKGWLNEGKNSKTPPKFIDKNVTARCVVFNEKACEKISLYADESKSLIDQIEQARQEMLIDDDYSSSMDEWGAL